ncbi:MAG: LamG-like jellyroll fold domain-containing protein [Candidatus Omnitrophota bacterium]|nr:LamG-like jellyroll fold domain-containing protein [Candidatus Omnitrophota bacterium]
MVLPNKSKIAFKIISATLAGIFLFEQIAWAGDLINTALEQQYQEQSQTFAPEYLQNQQSIAESLVSQQQASEDYMATQTLLQDTSSTTTQEEEPIIDLQGPQGGGEPAPSVSTTSTTTDTQTPVQDNSAVISVTTVDGDKVSYKDSVIDCIERPDGTTLRNIVLDGSNNLTSADIYHPDGTIQIVNNGTTLKIIKPDGVTYNYNSEELIESAVYTDGRVVNYSYLKDGLGDVVETTLTDPEKTSRYDPNNRLKKVEFNTGKTIGYDGGILSWVTDVDGKTYVYKKETTNIDGNITYAVSLENIIGQDGSIYYYVPFITGDFNLDGAIDDTDVDILSAGYGGSDKTYSEGDANYDGRVDDTDVDIFSANYGQGQFRANGGNIFYASDFDLDGAVGDSDVDILLVNYGSSDKTYSEGDANRDGIVDDTDIDLFMASYGNIQTNPGPVLDDIYADTIIYNQDASVKEILKATGETISFKEGLVDNVLAGSILTQYSYSLTESNNIEGISLIRDGVKRIYDKYGNLSRITGGGVALNTQNGEVTKIEKEDGTVIEDAVFDTDNNIVSAKITKPDGVQAVYSDGVLTEAHQPDGGIFYYDVSGNIAKLVNAKGITYIYSTITEGDQIYTVANAEALDSITDPEEIVFQKYNSDKRLIEARRKNGTVINYNYSGGKVIASDGKVVTTYDENNNIEKTEVLPAADDPLSTISEYEYGRIRRVYKGNDLIYRYSYEFDDVGAEVTRIEDIATKDIKRYKDEFLVSVTDAKDIVTAYEYDADKKISKSTATYLGKMINQYTYTYDGDNTIIEDIDGVRRAYDKDDRLTRLEEDWRTYDYTYTADDAGTEISAQALVAVRDDTGVITNYRNGSIESVVRPDGTVLTNIVVTNGVATSYVAQKDGIAYYIENDRVVREIKADGTDIEYYANNGWAKSITSPDGEVTLYAYDFGTEDNVEYIHATKDEIAYKFDSAGLINQVEYADGQILNYIYSETEPQTLEKYELVKNAAHYFYDTQDRLIRVVDSSGREYDYEYTEEEASVTSIYTSRYSSIEDIISFSKENLRFIDNGVDEYLEIEKYKDLDTPLLLHLNDTNGAASTIDDSYADYEVVFNGDARLDATSARFGSSSLYLDGSGDYLSVSDSPDWDFGTGDFTLETFVNFNSLGTAYFFDRNNTNGYTLYWHNNNIYYASNGSDKVSQYWVPQVNRWYHVALVRSSGLVKIFVDGTQLGSDVADNTDLTYANPLIIGASANGGNSFNGWMDEVKIVKGKALWTSSFTPPASEHIDALYKTTGSITSTPIEINATQLGSISWNEYLPETTDITTQTRTGDTPDPDDGTWSEWSEELTDSASAAIMSPAAKFIQYKVNFKSLDSMATPRLIPDANGNFVQIDYVENLTILSAATNGSGSDMELIKLDNVDTLRLAGYPDPDTPLLLHLNDTNGAASNIDDSYADHEVVFNGDAHIDSSDSDFFNSATLNLDGNDDYMTIPDSPDWDFGTGDFTVEMWFKQDTIKSAEFITIGGFYSQGKGILVSSSDSGRAIDVYLNGGYPLETYWNITANTWYHLAVTRASGTLRIFLNGTQIASGSDPRSIDGGTLGTRIGYGQYNYFNGFVKEVRISNSARYTSSFTPQTSQFASDSNTNLLLHLDQSNGMDSSPVPHAGITLNGNAVISKPYAFGTGSIRFDGSGDYLAMPDSPDWDFGTGDFTLETFVKFKSLSTAYFFDRNNTNGYTLYWHNNNIYYAANGLNKASQYWAPETNKWYHVALVRSSGRIKIFVDGTQLGSDVADTTDLTYINSLTIGASANGSNSFNGWMDEIRVSKGVARWGGPFTAPTEEYNDLYKTSGLVISSPIPIVATEISGIIANINEPPGTAVAFRTRTGATANLDDGTWSGWVDSTRTASGWSVNSPVNKYLQYQLAMNTTDPGRTPSIYSDGDALIKLGYIYIKGFDATAPPEDLVFRGLLTIAPLVIPQSLQLSNLNPEFIYFNPLAAEIASRILPDSTIIETKSFKEDSRDVTVETTKDGKLTYYLDGKVQATYQKYDDNHLEMLVEYSYDGEGSLVSVNLPSARNSIDTQITLARQQIAEERANYLRTLAEQKGLAYTQIRDQVQIIRDQINTERSRLQPMLYQEVQRQRWVGWWIFGWYETYAETIEVSEVRGALNQLNEQERILNDEEANAYAELNSEVASTETDLIQDEEAALAEIAAQEEEFHVQIIAEESTPVILEYYRTILGRDPDDAETQSWLNTVGYDSKINVATLKNALFNSQERTDQEVFVAALKDRIETELSNYINSDEAGKESLLSTLGLSMAKGVPLSQKDVDAILSLLDKQNIHFGRSAFVALGTVLSNNGITYDLEDLALKTILVDIFTGSLNKFSEGTLLELSMYALSKTASSYGVELNNTRLNYDELKQVFNSSGQVVVHLVNNHYVVVTNIAADGKISYVERNRGQDGYTWTVSRQDFENSWTGYAIVQTTSTKGTIPDTVLAKKISDDTAMRVKGSCLPFLFPLLGMIFGAITGVATAVVGAIGAIVAGISAVIGPIIAGIGQLITGIAGFMTQIGGALFSAVQFVGTSLLPTIGGWIGGIGSWIGGIGAAIGNGFGLGGIISATGFNLTGLGLALGKTVVSVALSMGISKGLELLGVNSTISGLLSSFVTGGVSGLFNNGFSVLSFITGGIQGLAIQGVNELAPRLGIDPMLTNVIGMTAGAFIGAVGNNISPETGLFSLEGFSTSIGTQIMPSVAGELAYYGITKAGELLGVDPRISYVSGCLIRSYINPGIDPETGNPRTMWQGITDGLLQGVTSGGLNYATTELGLDPLLANIGFSAISGAINAGIQAATGGSQDIFKTIFETYEKNALNFLGYTEPGTTLSPWQQAAYISQILDFSNIVKDKGIVNALNTYGASFFNAVAVNQIIQSGLSIGDYFNNKLDNNQGVTRTLKDGTQVTQVAIKDAQGNIVSNVFFVKNTDGKWNVVGKEDLTPNGTYLSWGTLGVDTYGKLGYTDAQLYSIFNSDTQFQRIQDGQQTYAEIKDLQGNTLIIIEPTADGHFNAYNSYGDYVDAKISSPLSGKSYSFSNDMLKQYQEFDITDNTSLFDVDFSKLAAIGLMFNSLSISSGDIAKFSFTDAQKQQITYVILNGIGNPFPAGMAPSYMRGFETQLAIADPSGATVKSIAMFPNSGSLPIDAKMDDTVNWIANAYLGSHYLTNDVITGMQAQFNGQIPSNMTGVAYSGSGDPLIQALNENPNWDIKSIVLVDTPIGFERKITNPNVNNVIMIAADGDLLSIHGLISQGFETNPRPLNVYKIVLNGVSHTQFSYDPNNTNPDPVSVQSARFTAEMAVRGNDTASIRSFLANQVEIGSIKYDSQTKSYLVDLSKVKYGN